jgi:hypothetical protein
MAALARVPGSCAGASAGGEGSDAAATEGRRRREDVVSVQIEQVGRQFTVEAPGILVLEDAEGQGRFELTAEAYRQVLDIVLEPEFVEAIAIPSLTFEECPSISDGGFTTVVVWADIGTQATPWGQCMDVSHPCKRLVPLLLEMLKKYFDCPIVDISVVPGRQLCNGCWSVPRDWVAAC